MRVTWNEETALKAKRVGRTEQPKPMVERAAVAMAALAFAHLIPGGKMRVAREKDHTDFWLPRLRCALEISGTEHNQELLRRQKEKMTQMLANPRRWDGYVFLCCFRPGNNIIRWSFHKQEEREDATS